MRKEVRWGKVLFLMTLSFEIVVFALAAIYVVWLFTTPLNIINSIALTFAGVVGFALGTMLFWRLSIRLSRQRSDF